MPNPVARAARPRRRRSGDASANLQFLTVGELEAVIDGIPNVSNGDRGVVHAVDGDGLYVRFDDAYRFLPREFDESTTRRGDPSVQHGYAITAYVAQRMTCRAAFVFARDDLYREWAYTALSRGRDANRLYVVAESGSLRAEIAPSAPTRDARRVLVDALGPQPARDHGQRTGAKSTAGL